MYQVPLEMICRHDRTAEVCRAAVEEDGWQLENVPEEMKTPELCRKALETEAGFGNDFHRGLVQHIPSPEVCMEVLKECRENNPEELYGVAVAIRPEVMNGEMADFLLPLDGRCISILPVHLQTPERVRVAVETSGMSAVGRGGVPKSLLTPDVYVRCAAHSRESLMMIPWAERSPEVCLCQVLVSLNGSLTGGTSLGDHGLTHQVSGRGIIGAIFHNDHLCILCISLGGSGVLHDVIGQSHTVPDAVDALGIQLHHLGIPVDLHKLRLHAQLFADSSGQLGIKTREVAIRIGVVHGLVNGVADDQLSLALDVIQVAACGLGNGSTAGSRSRGRCGSGCGSGTAAGGKAQCHGTGQECRYKTFHIRFLPQWQAALFYCFTMLNR